MEQKFNFAKLDERTRRLMIEEIELGHQEGQLYYSARFNDIGAQNWLNWLKTAATQFNEHWLSYQIEAAGAMKHLETRVKPLGGYSIAHVPDTAAETIADGQFNRYYMAAICRRTIEDNKGNVIAYRAKQRRIPRPESIALEGAQYNAESLLKELRSKANSLKCSLLRPNSGLSIDC